ncbi:hypothetical protein [Psychrobacillus psychrotolerans]|uniref:hypothetical protein n=1 Tax=Psychrobacillus psychrotolerans TaxID=126156 RepID=UPI0033161834
MNFEDNNTIDRAEYIEKGYIDADDEVAFRRIYEACNIFGHNYKGFFKGGAKHPYRNDVTIWFPKLNSKNWINTLSTDEEYIFERPADANLVKEHMNHHISSDIHKRIVFVYEEDSKGQFKYRFKGEYEIDVQQSAKEKCLIWKRIMKRVETYPPKK